MEWIFIQFIQALLYTPTFFLLSIFLLSHSFFSSSGGRRLPRIFLFVILLFPFAILVSLLRPESPEYGWNQQHLRSRSG